MFNKSTELISISIFLLRKSLDKNHVWNQKRLDNKIKVLSLILTIFFTVTTPASALNASKVYEKVFPSTVIVWATQKDGIKSQGSGVIVGHGEVVTNCHVLAKADSIANSIMVQDNNGARKIATLSGANWEKDICLLKSRDLKGRIINTRSSESLKVGEVVYAISAPRGTYRISTGQVSQLHKRDRNDPPVIITSAQLAPGMSGGGLFDKYGKLVGITTKGYLGKTTKYSGFAYPTEWINWTRRRGIKKTSDTKLKKLFGESSKDNRKIALTLIKSQNWRSLEKHCLQWLELFPSDESAWYFLGLAYFKQDIYYKAIDSYLNAVNTNPEYKEAWYNLGVVYGKQGLYKKSIDSYRRVVSIDSDNSKAWYNMVITYLSDGQHKRAEKAYSQLEKIDPISAIKLKDHFSP